MLKSGLTSLIVLLAAGFVRLAEAREIALHISLIDHVAITEQNYHFMNWTMNRILPKHTIWGVPINLTRFLFREEAIRKNILKRLARLPLKPGDHITHFIVDTHGSSYTNDKGQSRTSLKHFGTFSAEGPDQRLAEVLAPLRDYFAEDASFIMNACSIMCRGKVESEARAKGLMAYLGAPHGQVFGSVVGETNEYYNIPFVPSVLWLFSTLASLPVTSRWEDSGSITTNAIANAAILPTIIMGAFALWPNVSTFVANTSGLGNHGRLIRLRDGVVESSELVESRKSIRALYDRSSCDFVLGLNSANFENY